MRRLLLAPLLALLVLTLGTASAEANPPRITAICVGAPSCIGWFNADVHLRWQIDDGVGSNCGELWITTDTPREGVFKTCTAENPLTQETASASVKIQRDATPPDVSEAVPDRPPDYGGWYTHPVTFAPRGSDVTSGVAGCSSVTYGGPDNANGQVVAICSDVAGNVGSRPFSLRYDATAPDLAGALAKASDRVVRLSWPAATNARVVRTPGVGGAASLVLYDGPGNSLTDKRVRNGRRYRYSLTLTDQAGNSASIELSGIPARRLLSPAKRAVVAVPPLLDWTSVRGANYYNVQLFHKGRKILSEWPRRSQLQLKKTWRHHGKRRHLRAGKTYTWYVWPGEGRRASHRYGRLIGRRSFTFAPV